MSTTFLSNVETVQVCVKCDWHSLPSEHVAYKCPECAGDVKTVEGRYRILREKEFCNIKHTVVGFIKS